MSAADSTAIALDGVSLCYRLAKQRIPSFKEYAIHWLKGALVYEQLWALREISCRIAPGEAVGVVGRNGAGKSTLLKVVAGVLTPTSGRCATSGRVAPILELGTGFDHELTGWENIFLNALLLGHRRREIEKKAEEIVDFSELGDFIHAPLRNYSTGMVARLGFAIATAWRPDVLLLDEVFAVGDLAFARKCERRMADLLGGGTTFLLVSHAPSFVLENCSRCLWLDGGRLVADGEPSDVVAGYLEATVSAAGAPPLRTPPPSSLRAL